MLILASAQMCSICPNRVTGETKVFASQCKLRKGHDGRRNYDAHRVDFSAKYCNFSKICFIPRRYFNQLDAISKVMY